MYASFSLTTTPQAERFGSFQAIVNELFCPMTVYPGASGPTQFTGCVEATDLGGIRLARVAASACLVRRRAEDIARMTETPYLVKFQVKGNSIWSQRGRVVRLRPGDFVLCSTAEPYSLRFSDAFEMPVICLPVDTARRLTPDPDQFLGIRMPGEDVDCGLLSSFVAQVSTRMGGLQEPLMRRVEASILDLLGGVLSARTGHGRPSADEYLVQIKAYIGEHLHDRRLSPAMIAAAIGVSTRYVHSLFQSEPMTVGQYIRSLRVTACRRSLEGLAADKGSLTDIALRWGFYDLSHMSRCFRAEFGASPSEFRSQQDPDARRFAVQASLRWASADRQ
jgi:AraC-like DNA-binding protein